MRFHQQLSNDPPGKSRRTTLQPSSGYRRVEIQHPDSLDSTALFRRIEHYLTDKAVHIFQYAWKSAKFKSTFYSMSTFLTTVTITILSQWTKFNVLQPLHTFVKCPLVTPLGPCHKHCKVRHPTSYDTQTDNILMWLYDKVELQQLFKREVIASCSMVYFQI